MHTRMTNMGARLALAAIAGASLTALAACGEQPYPAAAPEQATEAPAPGDASLMGAPQGPGYPPTTRTPEYVPPAAEGPPGFGGPPGYPPPPPSPGMGPAYAQSAYPPGYGRRADEGGASQVVSMAPIPNPPERGEYYGRWYGPHHPHRVWLYGEDAAPAYHHRYHQRFYAHAPRKSAAPAAPAHATPAHPEGHAPLPGHAMAAGAAGAAVGAAQFAKPHALAGRHHHGVDKTTASEASGGSTNTIGANTMASGTEAERFQALQSALHDAFERAAVLSVPASMEANQAATVTLQLPQAFAQTARDQAARQGLSDAAASMNLIATLSGDGYTIVPAEAQTLPLTAEQPTTFQWKVTPTGAARGALKASVRAQAVGAGQYMTLGDKTQGAGALAGRVIGIGILAVIVLVLLGWAARRRPRPKPTGAVKPNAAYDRPPY